MADQHKQAPLFEMKPAPKLPLAQAGASCDGAVQCLLAEMNTAHMNGDKAAVAVIAQQLFEFGYE